jgi:subtilisin family serine protease
VSFSGQVPATFAGQVKALGGKVLWVSRGSRLATVSGLSSSAAASLAGTQGIAAVDADESLSLEMPRLTAPDAAAGGVASNANPAGAARYARQWNMLAVRADAAWAAGFLGSPAVSIFMLDTGIDYLHSDLVGRVDLTRSTDLLGTFIDNDGVSFTEADTVAKYFPARTRGRPSAATPSGQRASRP